MLLKEFYFLNKFFEKSLNTESLVAHCWRQILLLNFYLFLVFLLGRRLIRQCLWHVEIEFLPSRWHLKLGQHYSMLLKLLLNQHLILILITLGILLTRTLCIIALQEVFIIPFAVHYDFINYKREIL